MMGVCAPRCAGVGSMDPFDSDLGSDPSLSFCEMPEGSDVVSAPPDLDHESGHDVADARTPSLSLCTAPDSSDVGSRVLGDTDGESESFTSDDPFPIRARAASSQATNGDPPEADPLAEASRESEERLDVVEALAGLQLEEDCDAEGNAAQIRTVRSQEPRPTDGMDVRELSIDLLSGTTFVSLLVDVTWTVGRLKREIELQAPGTSAKGPSLVFGSVVLDDNDLTIYELGLPKGASLHIVLSGPCRACQFEAKKPGLCHMLDHSCWR
mmetsp:Transcript_115790/g.327520  ORF Transcript_115790/g.327520 Transcript_115790/m.327520 type:complete len:268 (-) Transcript_115790:477-1280(-)